MESIARILGAVVGIIIFGAVFYAVGHVNASVSEALNIHRYLTFFPVLAAMGAAAQLAIFALVGAFALVCTGASKVAGR